MPGGQITQWLEKWRSGDAQALERLMPLVYDELRQVAKRQLSRESPAHTLSSTALVHEVYLRLIQQRQMAASDREHFYAIAGHTMRRILVDHARARMRLKRGGGRPVPLEGAEYVATDVRMGTALALLESGRAAEAEAFARDALAGVASVENDPTRA